MTRDEGTVRHGRKSPAYLLVGSVHDNALLVCQKLLLDSFAAPLSLTIRTRTAVNDRTPIQVCLPPPALSLPSRPASSTAENELAHCCTAGGGICHP